MSPTRIADIIATHLGGQLHIVQANGRLTFDFIAPLRPPAETPVDSHQPPLAVIAPHLTIN